MSNNTFIVFLKGNGNNKLYYPTAINEKDFERLHKNILYGIDDEPVTLGQSNNSINCGKIQFKLKKGNGNWENIGCVSVLNNKGNKKLHIMYKDGKEENINFSRLSIRSKDLSSSSNKEGYTTNENINSSNEEENNNEKENITTKLSKLKPLGNLEKSKYKSEINEKQLNEIFHISTNYKNNLSNYKSKINEENRLRLIREKYKKIHQNINQKHKNKHEEISKRYNYEKIERQKIINEKNRQKNVKKANNLIKEKSKEEESIRLARKEEANRITREAKEEEANKIAREKLEESKRIKNEKNAKYKNLMSKVQSAKKSIQNKFKDEESIRLAREAKEKEEEANRIAKEKSNRIAKEKANRIAKEDKRLAIEAKKLANEVKRLANEKEDYRKLQKNYLNVNHKKKVFKIKKELNGGLSRKKKYDLKKFLKLHLKYLKNSKTNINKYKFNNNNNISYLKEHIIKGDKSLETNRKITDLL